MIPYTEYGTFYILYKDTAIEWPVGRTLKLALVSLLPRNRPYHQTVPVGCFKELVAGSYAPSPDPYKVYVCVTAQVQFMIIPCRIPVQHHVGHPCSPGQMHPPVVT